MAIQETQDPTFYIANRRQNPSDKDYEIISVYCENCQKLHTHGVRKDDLLPTHRVSHCGASRIVSGYWIDERPS